IGSRAEALDRGIDDARVDLLDAAPGEALPIEHAGSEILDQDVALLQEPDEDVLAMGRFHIDGDAALVAVQHGEIEAVRIGNVAQLGTRDIAAPRQLDFDHVGAEPGEDLGRRRSRLNMRHVENANALQSLTHDRRSSVPASYLYMVWFMVPGA